jgi:pimeloyl-ACP methyl ester carboxylesterase
MCRRYVALALSMFLTSSTMYAADFWVTASSFDPTVNISALAPLGDNELLATTSKACQDNMALGVLRSLDHGNSWTPINTGLTSTNVRSMTTTAHGDILIGTHDGVFRLNGTHDSWGASGLRGIDVSVLYTSPDGIIWAADSCYCTGLRRSLDDGATWESFGAGLAPCINDLVEDSSGNLYAATGTSGVFRLSPQGSVWSSSNDGLTVSDTISLTANQAGKVFVGTAFGAYRRRSPVSAWESLTLSGIPSDRVEAFAFGSRGEMYAGTYRHGVLVSEDEGSTWVAQNSGIADISGTVGAITLGKDGFVYAGLGSTVYRSSSSRLLEPIVFVPGISGSQLNNVNGEVWPDIDKMIGTALTGNRYLDDLQLDDLGNQIPGKEIAAVDVMREVGFVKFYGPLLSYLAQQGYAENHNVFTAPYDWRLSVTLANQVEALKTKVDAAIAASPSGMITIIGHSMGGLLVKEFLRSSPPERSHLRAVIFAGVPNLGVPKAFKVLNFGDNLGIPILNSSEIEKISRNMPGIYFLLPSREYLNRVFTKSFISDFGRTSGTLSYDDTTSFMMQNGKNSFLLTTADQFHEARDLEPLNLAPSTKFYVIAGCEEAQTIGRFLLYGQELGGREVQLEMTDGDGTVPLSSANSFPNVTRTFFSLGQTTGADHTGLVNKPLLLSLIGSLLAGEENPKVPGISQDASECLKTRAARFLISTHSPVALHVYDQQGRHLGPATTGGFEIGIPDGWYDTVANNSFALVPVSGEYRVVLQANGVGTASLNLEELNGVDVEAKATYRDVPITTLATQAQLRFTRVQNVGQIQIDANGDGVYESSVSPTSILSGAASADVVPPDITIGNVTQDIVLHTALPIVFSARDDFSGVALLSGMLDGKAFQSGLSVEALGVGNHLIEIRAVDRAGNPSVARKSFHISYAFSGFLPPIAADGRGVYPLMRSFPVVVRITDASGHPVPNLKATLGYSRVSGVPASGSVPLAYLPWLGIYGYLLDTRGLGEGVWELRITLDDGNSYAVRVTLARKGERD